MGLAPELRSFEHHNLGEQARGFVDFVIREPLAEFG
jgi:hypothetical protein